MFGIEYPIFIDPQVIAVDYPEDQIRYTIQYPDGTYHEQRWEDCAYGAYGQMKVYRIWKTRSGANRALKRVMKDWKLPK